MSVSRSCVDDGLVRQAQALVDELRRRQLTVVTAESCTGGLIASLLSHGTGASECLHGGFVAYTKVHKAIALGVSRELLQRQGSVNAEVARQLAQGALERSPANIAVAVTGVLGPDADEDGNPPELVWFAVTRTGHDPRVIEEHFNHGDPDDVRRAAILRALTLLGESASS
jgi:nicotinamide-nucleotide amidase